MKLTRIWVLIVCLAAVAACGAWADPVALKHGLSAGDVSYYKKASTSEQTEGMGVGAKEQATAYYKQTVSKVEDGRLHLKLDYKGVDAEVPMMMGTNPYDSLAGKSFDLVIAENGEEVKPIDFGGKIPSGVAYVSVCALADCILKEVYLPENEVNAGDTWEYDLTKYTPNLGEGLEVKITGGQVTYKLDKIEDVGGRECAIISYTVESTSKFDMPQTEVQPGLPFKMDLSGDGTDKGKGTITFDPAEGRLVKYVYDGKMDMTIRFENVPEELAGQLPESMAIAEDTGVVVTLIDQSEFDAALSSKDDATEEAPPPPSE